MKLNVCSFNIKCRGPRDGINILDNRLPLMRRSIAKYHPDVIGFQEGGLTTTLLIRDQLPDYTVVGTHMSLNEEGTENTAIAFRTDRFDLISLDSFRLSETPYTRLTKFYSDQGFCYRVCTRVVLMDKQEKKILRCYNTHLDHEGTCCQAQALSLILRRMDEDDRLYPNTPVVLTGDFNLMPQDPILSSLSGFCLGAGKLKEATALVKHTFHDFGRCEPYIKIDYIFTNAVCDPADSFAWTDRDGELWLSDHHPVQTTIEI